MTKPESTENIDQPLCDDLVENNQDDDIQNDIEELSNSPCDPNWILNSRRRLGKIHHHKRCMHRSHRKH